MNVLQMEVKALDPGHGYLVTLVGIVEGGRTKLEEHYATEAQAKARLATAWDWWAAQVDSE